MSFPTEIIRSRRNGKSILSISMSAGRLSLRRKDRLLVVTMARYWTRDQFFKLYPHLICNFHKDGLMLQFPRCDL